VGGCCSTGYSAKSDEDATKAKAAKVQTKVKDVVSKVTQSVSAQASELSKIADTKQEGKDVVVNLKGDLLFATASSKLTNAAKAKIAAIGAVLAKDKKSAIKVTGHTDSRGNEDNNLALSEARAEAVKDELIANGVSSGQISTSGKGSSVPVATNDTSAGRAANRRAEIRISH
jgi:outer membrane protein OmpA-like peptidoglycan-associated protein